MLRKPSANVPRHLFREFAATLAGEGIALASSVVSFVVLVLIIPKGEYGEYAGILGITTSIGALAWQALPMVVLEFTARSPDHWRSHLSYAWFLLAVSFPLCLACTAVLTRLMIPSARLWIALVVVTGDLSLWLTHSIAASRQATTGPRLAAKVRSAVAVIRAMGLIVGALIAPRLDVVVIASTATSWSAALWMIKRTVGVGISRPSRGYVKSVLSYQVGGSAVSIQEEIDKTFVLRISGEIPAASYAAVFRIFQVLALPLRALAGTLHTRLVVKQGSSKEAIRQLLRVSIITTLYGCAGWLALTLLSGPLTSALPDRFGTDRRLFVVLGAMLPLRGLGPHAANLLVGFGLRTQRAVAQFVGCVVAIGLYVTLIPRQGPLGAAIASLIAEATVLSLVWGFLIVLGGDRPRHASKGSRRRPASHRRTAD